MKRFAHHLGLSRGAANQLSLCHPINYISLAGSAIGPGASVGAILFRLLLFPKLRTFCCSSRQKNFSVSAIKGCRSTLTLVFKYCLPELLDSYNLCDLIHSFEIERPHHPVGPPSWDLIKVLEYLLDFVFEPLSSKPLWIVTMKVSFLLALAMAKRVGELQALSSRVASRGPDLSLAYLPEFVAKKESEHNPLPLSFLVISLEDFVGNLPEERLLCPVRAVRTYLGLISTL